MLRDAQLGHDPSGSSLGERDRRVLVCARCQRVITSAADRIEFGGAHEHVFVNPDGERFRIGCFGGASGLLRVGPAILEATWFPAYTWQNEACAGCRAFMGWLYRKGEHRFHGLILDALLEVDEG